MLNFILGKSGSSKTTYILEQMQKKSSSNEHSSIVFLVPEQYSLQAERDILQKTKATSINVLSFGRLAYRVFSETGLKNKIILDEVSLSMLLRKILIDVSDKLEYYKKTKITTGFISKLAVTMAQIEAGYLTEEVLIQLFDRSDNLAYKTKDVFTIYKEFSARTNENYISTEQALSFLADKIKDSRLVKSSHIFIDGFSSFSTHEYKVIENLIKTSKSTTVAITIDEKTAMSKEMDETNVFFETKNTFSKIENIAQSLSVPIEKKYFLDNIRHTENIELAILEQNLFDFKHRFSADTKNITLTPHENIYKEVTATASNIIELVEDYGYSYYDIAVLAPDNYGTAIKNIFGDYGIPIFIDQTGDISSHPLINTFLSAINATVYNWSAEHIFSFLKSGLTNIDKNHIDLLENYVLAHNIKSYKWKLEQWIYPVPFSKDESQLQLINEIKNQVVSILELFEAALKNKSMEQIVVALFEAMTNSQIFYNYQKNIENDKDEERRKDDLLIYNKLITLLQTMIEFLGDNKTYYWTPKDFLKVIESGIEATSRGKVPENIDSVIIASQGRSRLPAIKAMFVLGAASQIGEDNSLFTDIQKATLKSYGSSFPLSNDKVFENNFSIYSYFTKPSEFLHISYAVSDLSGQVLGASPLVSILKNKNISSKEVVLRHTQKTKERILSVYEYNQNLLNGEYTKKSYDLSKESLSKLYDKDIYTSISRLEKYASCPFSYFVQYNLKAKERKVFGLTNLEYGDFFHNWLEEFMLYADKEKIDFSTITKKEIYSFLGKITDKLSKESNLFGTNRDKTIFKKLIDITTTSIWAMCRQVSAGDFSFHDAEIEFGKDKTLNSIIIDINGINKFVLNGKIDRIDMLYTDESGVERSYIKIIDYKSSSKSLDIEEVKKGLQLQLLTYMQAALDQGEMFGIDGEFLPGGILYFSMDNPWLSGDDLEAALLKSFTMNGLVLDEPTVIAAFENKDVQVISSKKGRVSIDDFRKHMLTASNSIKDIGEHILDGYIEPVPFKHGSKTGCDYCKYRPICNFDEKISTYNK